MSTAEIAQGRTFLLEGESWDLYLRLLRTFEGRRRLRITYDRGALEIMTLSAEHEGWKHFIARLIIALTEELGLPVAGYGSLTIKRRGKRRGLEPDECFWIAHEQFVRNLKQYSPRRDPPPDLVLEVEVSRSALDRLGIYAVLRVPEVWRFDGRVIQFLVLDEYGEYAPQQRSKAFPLVTPADIERVTAQRGTLELNTLIRQFRDWVRRAVPSSLESRTSG